MSWSHRISDVGESVFRMANSTCDLCSGGRTATPISTPEGKDSLLISVTVSEFRNKTSQWEYTLLLVDNFTRLGERDFQNIQT